MVRELKKTCDDYILEVLQQLENIASIRDSIEIYEHLKSEHSDTWHKWKMRKGKEESDPEVYLMNEKKLLETLRKKVEIAIAGIYDTCNITR